jgi:hypothetical protein
MFNDCDEICKLLFSILKTTRINKQWTMSNEQWAMSSEQWAIGHW